MKKLLASALLAGLLLGTTAPVFADEEYKVTGTQSEENPTAENSQETKLSSTIAASYTVTIPGDLTITLGENYKFNTVESKVTLDSLNAKGKVSVTAETGNLTLLDAEDEVKDTLTISTKVGGSEINNFDLSNNMDTLSESGTFTFGTDDLSNEHLPGQYEGTITYNLEYREGSN